ncbi:RND family efflux transporter, MFP subunit [Mucilaginibacter pineti]|uniref:RND family efflux transporter, MFP subunit n=1 Tax=Mucilaginibacter pineti TaxID=1391627 RepID=A0A1G6UIH6_9SPHI|nr:efflux RND transporter periplasmic adaptor subunit [Mucilaginibacter pineti]SDD41113.1 RND family efflux transporter, MFP subunit [Mucilaginibacter pineti]
MKKIKYTGLLLCIPFIYACKPHPVTVSNKGGADTIAVQVRPLKQQANNATIAVSGQFTTDDEVMLSFKTGGIISNLNVKEGDAVKKGQLLATLNPTEINAQVQQANLATEKAQRDYERAQNLYKDSVATLEQLQNSKTNLQQAQQQLKAAAFNRQYSEIRAPKDGYILHKLANVGQQVTAGSAVLQANGAEAGKWMLRVGISDREWATMQLKDPAIIQTTAMPGQLLQGVVSRKSEGVDAETGTFSADITITGKKPQAIAAGMFGKATIIPSRSSNAGNTTWQIPYDALLDGDGNSGYVFVTDDNKTAHKVKVTVAGIEKNTVTVSSGLADAKALIISGSAYLTDNSVITVKSPQTASK